MSGKKYELTDTTIAVDAHILHRIRALRDFGKVKAGELGGYIESEANLAQIGNCWVAERAEVYEYAVVSGQAYIAGNARVCGHARISGAAAVKGNARVCGHAVIDGKAIATEHSHVSEFARVSDDAFVGGHADISGMVEIKGRTLIHGGARVSGYHIVISGSPEISGQATIDEVTDFSSKSMKVVVRGAQLWASGDATIVD